MLCNFRAISVVWLSISHCLFFALQPKFIGRISFSKASVTLEQYSDIAWCYWILSIVHIFLLSPVCNLTKNTPRACIIIRLDLIRIDFSFDSKSVRFCKFNPVNRWICSSEIYLSVICLNNVASMCITITLKIFLTLLNL